MEEKWVAKETDPITSKYEIGEQLGQPGQFGIAKLCTRLSDQAKFAVKIIDKTRFLVNDDVDKMFQDLRGEIDVMRTLDHENIVKLYEVYETKLELYLVQELCSGGELFDMITKLGRYTEKDAAGVLVQIFRGLSHMHAKEIAHCDLKPDNFLFHESGKLKIIDFGMSKRIPRGYLTSLCGTPYYTAPEVIKGRYHKAADCWAVGVVMFVMLFGYPPFYVDPQKYGEREHEMVYKKIKKGFIPKVKKGYGRHFPDSLSSSDEAKDLMKMLMRKSVADRLTAVEALDHKWFQNASSDHTISAQVTASLLSLTKASRFKLTILEIFKDIAITDEKREHLRETFDAMDEDGNGTVSLTEFQHTMLKTDTMTEEAAARIFAAADINGDTELSFDELLLTIADHQLKNVNERMSRMFLEIDENGDGNLSPEEIKAYFEKSLKDDPLMKELGLLDDIDGIVKEADKNGDGQISYIEFVQVINPEAFKLDKIDENSDSDEKEAKESVEVLQQLSCREIFPFANESKDDEKKA